MNKKLLITLLSAVLLISCACTIAFAKPEIIVGEDLSVDRAQISRDIAQIQQVLGTDESIQFVQKDEMLNLCEYESNQGYYTIDRASGEIMTYVPRRDSAASILSGKQRSGNAKLTEKTALQLAKNAISLLDETFFAGDVETDITFFEDGAASIVYEQLLENNVKNGRIAGVRLDGNGKVESVAFNISKAAALANEQRLKNQASTISTKHQNAISKERAIAIAEEEAGRLAAAFAQEMNALAPEAGDPDAAFVDDHENTVKYSELNAPEFKVYLDSDAKTITAEQSFYQSEPVWNVVIDAVGTSYDTEMCFWVTIHMETGEILSSERSA